METCRCAGIDCAKDTHDVVVQELDGEIVWASTIAHTEAGIEKHHLWAQDRYASASARRQDHPRAIRTLGRAWTRVLWRCRQNRVAYDPTLHNGLQNHLKIVTPDL